MTASSIEWTDEVWNPIRGCSKVSPGCKNCYAETFAERWRGVKGHPYEQGFDLRLVPEKLTEPLAWRKPRRVFVNSMSDPFQDGVPFPFIAAMFAVMAICPHITFQMLTKRPARMVQFFEWLDEHVERLAAVFPAHPASWRRGHMLATMAHNATGRIFTSSDVEEADWPLPNVWLGSSAENEDMLQDRWPYLRACPAAIRFLSLEPLLEEVNLDAAIFNRRGCSGGPALADCQECGVETIRPDWIIVGGESGPGARRFDVEWARTVIAECKAASVACFVKQLGSQPREYAEIAGAMAHVKLRDRKGGDPDEWPRDLRVRQFPEVRR